MLEKNTALCTDTYTNQCLQVFEVLLDVPQCRGAVLELSHLVILQLLIDHTGQPHGSQHTRKAQEHFVFNAVHTLQPQTGKLENPPFLSLTGKFNHC
uniref:Uncharacterized protein n=1 Tax=Naja naja TaxID=35670 RepID=A0A8C6VSZ9_NAJNA